MDPSVANWPTGASEGAGVLRHLGTLNVWPAAATPAAVALFADVPGWGGGTAAVALFADVPGWGGDTAAVILFADVPGWGGGTAAVALFADVPGWGGGTAAVILFADVPGWGGGTAAVILFADVPGWGGGTAAFALFADVPGWGGDTAAVILFVDVPGWGGGTAAAAPAVGGVAASAVGAGGGPVLESWPPPALGTSLSKPSVLPALLLASSCDDVDGGGVAFKLRRTLCAAGVLSSSLSPSGAPPGASLVLFSTNSPSLTMKEARVAGMGAECMGARLLQSKLPLPGAPWAIFAATADERIDEGEDVTLAADSAKQEDLQCRMGFAVQNEQLPVQQWRA